MASAALLALVALIIGVGVGAKVLANEYRLPSIIFLLISGVILGPTGLGLITQDTFGSSIGAIVGIAVAIIVFEGAFNLRIERIRRAQSSTVQLITVGAVIAFAGTTVLVHYALSAPWDISAVTGALLVATGPTVITPILDVVTVRDEVAAAMETEGIVNDVTAAIMAVVLFNTLVLGQGSAEVLLTSFVERLGIGLLVGSAGALGIYVALNRIGSNSQVQNARLITLAGAIVIYATANSFASEAGVAAVAAAGMILGNVDVPFYEEIEEFKGDITPLVLSLVFIILAALVNLQQIVELGIEAVLVVVGVIVIIRPLLVAVSTFRSDFSIRERLFVSLVGPRGIIPASVATLFAVELNNEATALRAEAATAATEHAGGSTMYEAGTVCTNSGIGQEAMTLCSEAARLEASASVLVSAVFLVIFATVIFQGGFARYIAEYLDVIPMNVIIIGGGTAGVKLAERLRSREESIVIVEKNEERVRELRQDYPFQIVQGDGREKEVLKEAGIERAGIAAAMTSDDDSNLFATKIAESQYGVERVFSRVNDPDNVGAFEDLGVQTVAAPEATATAVDNLIERGAMMDWMDDLKETGDVKDVTVMNEDYNEVTIQNISQDFPENVIVTLVTKGNGDRKVARADTEVETGDIITLLGTTSDVKEVEKMMS